MGLCGVWRRGKGEKRKGKEEEEKRTRIIALDYPFYT